jgi:uncharacterized delta-60 repeat protein
MNLTRKTFGFAQFILAVFVLTFSARAAGEVDPAFNPRLVDVDYVFYSGSIERTSVKRVAVQPDGKILATGIFNVVNDSVRDNIVRFNADGTLDTGFNPPALARFSGNELLIITALALQADGKILIGGNFVTTGAVGRTYLARLNADGSLDTSFNANQTGQSVSGTIRDIEISSDGKITVGGDISAGTRQDVIRILSDGTVDTAFTAQIPDTPSNSGAQDVFVQSDGEVLASFDYPNGAAIMYRFNADGSVDFSHTTDGQSDVANRIVVQPDGKILLAGSFNSIDGFPIPSGIARLNANGTVDPSFNFGNSGAGHDVVDVELLANGKILIGGWFQSYNGAERQYVAVLNSDGTLDASVPNASGRVMGAYDLAVQADGKIVVGTYADFSQGPLVPPIVRLNQDGALDSSVQPFMGTAGTVNKVLVQPDGKILVGGFYNHVNSDFRRNLSRFNQDGIYDSSFTGLIFYSAPTSSVRELDLQPDGKILVTGNIDGSSGRRINADGTHDVTLSNSANAPSVRYLPDGKLLLVSGEIVRYSSQGFFEAQTVRFNFNGVAYKAAIQPDGKIIIVGTFTEINFTTPRNRIARLNADATFDAAFDPPGGANGRINDVFLQADGKIVIAGEFTSVNSNPNYKYLARLHPDGMLDTSFNPILNASVTCLKLQPDGKILFGGAMTTVNGVPRSSVARVNSNGTLDTSFNLGAGADGLVRSIDIQADGKIIIGGEFRRVNGVERLGVARLLNTAVPIRPLFDYDGDGKSDVSVFRPSENRWYVFRSSDSVVAQQVFAIAGDLPVPADYDGDGKTDFAIFRPSSGDWWSLSSASGAQIYAHWGANGDIPRPSDFDGDGRTDYIVFRPSNSFWYRISSAPAGTVSNAAFGLAGDKPVTGDFDGDGKSDKAIFRPSTGDWWYQSSINGAQLAVHWGISTDVPAPADFDGDGKTDFAVYRPSTGVWYIINSSNFSFTIMNFGIAEDKPVPADYDGDGKADIAVFRPSTGIWYQMRSTQGFMAQQFGISSDVPTPNAFVP